MKKNGSSFVLAVISYLISIVIGHFLLHEREEYDLSIEKFAVTYDNCGFIGGSAWLCAFWKYRCYLCNRVCRCFSYFLLDTWHHAVVG